MTILVTGGTGYIGSHVVYELINEGEQVIAVDTEDTSHPQYVEGAEYFKFSYGDIEEMNKLLNLFDVEAVIHLGGLSYVRESMKMEKHYIRNNVEYGENLIRILKDHNISRFIFSSSCSVYGEPIYIPVDEYHITRPISVYGKTKLKMEKFVEQYDMDYINLRYFNVAGSNGVLGEEHKVETHVIPLLLQSLNKEELFEVYGNGNHERDFIHVLDLAKAHVLALKKMREGITKEVYNLGNGKGTTINELLDLAVFLFNKNLLVRYREKREEDPLILVSDIRKAKRELGFNPKYSVEDMMMSHWSWIHKGGK